MTATDKNQGLDELILAQAQTLPERRLALSKAILALLKQFEVDNPDVFVDSVDLLRDRDFRGTTFLNWVDVTVEVK